MIYIGVGKIMKNMRNFENVKYTRPYELIFLLVSTVAVLFLAIFLLNRVINIGLIKGLISLIVAVIYFKAIKKRFVVKMSNFKLTSDRLKWDNNKIDFKSIEYYKIHWIRGAGIKFKLKSGKTIHISSNESFCDSENFVRLCKVIDYELKKFNNNQIIRKKSLFETKKGYYYAVIMTVILVIITMYKILTKDKFNFQNIVLVIVSFGAMWSGVRWIKK
jgi:hypothetical protein